MRAIQITEFGGPEVLQMAELPEPEPGPTTTLIDVSAAGVNYADTHAAENSYLAKQVLPMVPGAEVVGVRRHDGARVVALLAGGGGYAQVAAAPEATTFTLPPAEVISDAAALSLVLQGATAWHLLRSCARLSEGESVVVHSGAGGVGSLAIQLARRWGAGRVVATASTPAKRDLALRLGADAAIDVSGLGTADEVCEALVAALEAPGADIILEMTGGHVFDGSLAALAPMGRLITYGMAARTPPAPVDVGSLMARSRAVVGFWLVHALRAPGGMEHAMEELLSMVEVGALQPVTGGHWPLEEAEQAHRAIRSRSTTGKLVLEVTR